MWQLNMHEVLSKRCCKREELRKRICAHFLLRILTLESQENNNHDKMCYSILSCVERLSACLDFLRDPWGLRSDSALWRGSRSLSVTLLGTSVREKWKERRWRSWWDKQLRKRNQTALWPVLIWDAGSLGGVQEGGYAEGHEQQVRRPKQSL